MRHEQIGLLVQQPIAAPASYRFLLDDADVQRVGPDPAYRGVAHPRFVQQQFTDLADIDTEETFIDGGNDRSLHMFRVQMRELAFDQHFAYRQRCRVGHFERAPGHRAGEDDHEQSEQRRGCRRQLARVGRFEACLVHDVPATSKLDASIVTTSSSKDMPASRAAIGTSE